MRHRVLNVPRTMEPQSSSSSSSAPPQPLPSIPHRSPDHHLNLPIMTFIRDDKETVAIMKEALRIVPIVCDILDEADVEAQVERATSNPLARPVRNTPAPSTSTPTASTSNSSQNGQEQSPSFRSGGPLKRSSTSSPPPLPPKKRLLARLVARPESQQTQQSPSTSQPSTPGNPAPPRRIEIKRQLQEDYDKFVNQIGFLASLERRKNDLLERFLRVSAQNSAARQNPQMSTIPTPPMIINGDIENANNNNNNDPPPPPEEADANN